MNRFKLIIKGILLWATAFMTTLFVLGVDGIYDSGYFLQILIAIIAMIFCCYKLISEEEFEILTLSKWLDNKLKKK